MSVPAAALVYLTFTSFKNRARVRLRRLRQPRYALGLIGGALYIYLAMFRQSAVLSSVVAGQGMLIGSVALFTVTALVWALPRPKNAMAFTLAEVRFLFPAPLTRRQLMQYKLLNLQVGSLFSAVISTVFYHPRSAAEAFRYFAGMSLLLGTWGIHLTALSLARQSLGRHGRSGFARQRGPLLVVAAALVTIVITLSSSWPALQSLPDAKSVPSAILQLTSTGPMGIVFWPFRALLRVPLSSSWWDCLRALPAAVGLLILNFVWALRVDSAFEEAAAAQAGKIAELQRTGAFRPKLRKTASTPFRLAPEGAPEMAIVWKNLILLGRYASLKMFLIVLPTFGAVGIGCVMAAKGDEGGLVALFLCGLALFNVVLFGPQAMKNDLRHDLSRMAILKTWPMSGAALVRGEGAAPALVLTCIAGPLSAACALLIDLPRLDRAAYALSALLVLPTVIGISLIMQNAFVLLFPAWSNSRANQTMGIDGLGQRMLLMFGGMLALSLALVPPALAAGLTWFAINVATGTEPILLPAAASAVVLLVECWLAMLALGRLFDRTDVSAIGPSEN